MKKLICNVILPVLASIALLSCGGGSGDSGTNGSASASSTCGQPGRRCGGTAGGMEYILYTPANFHQDTSALVLALHPLYQTGAVMESWTGLNAKADQEGFAVLYPSTPGQRMWCGYFRTCDDVSALRTLIAEVQIFLKADPKRIYTIGYSDGAVMAERVGVELGDVVAAIAPVSGNLYQQVFSNFANGNWSQTNPAVPIVFPKAVSPVSVLILHDDIIPNTNVYVCGWTYAGAYTFPSQDVVFNYWAGPLANDCATVDTTAPICTGSLLQQTTKKATDCKGSTQVQFYQLLNSFHNWHTIPGSWSAPLNNPYSGQPYNSAFNATTGITTNDIIWNFFAAHPKQ